MVPRMTRDELFDRVRAWRDADPNPETRAEAEALLEAGDEAVLRARFEGRLAFGTAGIRGTLGAGPQRMNRLMVRQVSAGVGAYYAASLDDARARGVVIGYDGRTGSRVFAEDTARVFLGLGYQVHLATGTVPTPLTAFATRDLGAACGVMVTASHNPPEYNGYKVYAPNGAQIIPPQDTGIAAAIEAVADIPLGDLEAARADGRLIDLGEEMKQRYLDGVMALRVHPEAADGTDLTVAYTPMHGVGAELAEAALKRAGYTQVHTVAAQREPDAAFPTVRFPNPEEEGAMDLVLALAEEVGADLACANDPDADRLAVALPGPGGWKLLTGDQVGTLLAYYLVTEGAGEGTRTVASSLVSSQLLGRMAEALGVTCLTTLTGFKWIANAAMDHSRDHGSRFVFGYEEALGYCVGELVRDKDGISAVTLFAELAAWLKRQDRTVSGLLEDVYRRFGFYLTEQRSRVLPGAEGLETMKALLARFRADPPRAIGGYAVVDYQDLAEGAMGLPPSDVLIYRLEGDRRVILRPSGTEPKLKSYYEVREPVAEGEPFADAAARARTALDALAEAHQGMLK